jgi:hypothetical protein
MRTAAIAILITMMTSCASSKVAFSESGEAYIRLTEYRATYPVIGGVTGCQLSQGGDTKGITVSLQTENCSAQSSQ